MAPSPPHAGGCSLPVGTPVRLHGLKTAATLNGRAGVCVGWDEASDRVCVRLDGGELKMLKDSNLWKVQGQAKTESCEVERVKSTEMASSTRASSRGSCRLWACSRRASASSWGTSIAMETALSSRSSWIGS